MSYEISHHWESQIEQIAQAQHISTDEALNRILEAGIERFRPKPVNADAPPRRSASRPPNLTVAEEFPIFGMFADKPEFSEAIDRVIASRSERYAKFTA